MAKKQNLSLNPTKISGICGRLMCCLKYENDQYNECDKKCENEEKNGRNEKILFIKVLIFYHAIIHLY